MKHDGSLHIMWWLFRGYHDFLSIVIVFHGHSIIFQRVIHDWLGMMTWDADNPMTRSSKNFQLRPSQSAHSRLHDSYLDELLPLSLRQAALRAQPGDVLKLQSERGMEGDGGDLVGGGEHVSFSILGIEYFWWWLEHDFYFSIYFGTIIENWRTHIFQGWNHQPEMVEKFHAIGHFHPQCMR